MAETGFNVVVIGGGIAGMVAANRAAELGKRVAVLEQSTEVQYICNSRITYGTFHINFTSPDATEDELVRKNRGRHRGPCEGRHRPRRRQGRPAADAMAARPGH